MDYVESDKETLRVQITLVSLKLTLVIKELEAVILT